jgi:hypothetical protein
MSGCDIIFYVNICKNFPLFCLCCGLFCGLLVACPTDTPPPPADTFMLYDSEGPNASGNWGKKLGVNTIPIYFDGWSDIENTENTFDWSTTIPGNSFEYSHCIARFGILHVMAWSPPDKIPDWVDPSDIDGEFKTKYGEFITAAIGELQSRGITVDAFLVELEANFAGHELPAAAGGNKTNAWIINWVKWECGQIHGLEPAAKIIVPLTPTEFKPNETLDNTGDLGRILMKDFITRMIGEGVSFDVYGFNVASGVYDQVDDWTAVQAVLDDFCASFDKEAYLWAFGYPADNSDNLPFVYPRAGGYSEEWQKEQYVATLGMLLDNPKVIGASIDLFDYQESGWASPFHWGLVQGDRAHPETCTKRPAFDAVKEYWEEHRR